MSLRNWLRVFVTAGSLAWSVGVTLESSVHAQPPAADAAVPPPATNVPRLPDVDVVAEPPTTAPAPNLYPNFDPFAAPDNVVTNNTFTAPAPVGYSAVGSTAGSIIAVPDLRFPGTISTVTPQMIRDQAALNFTDILRDIGGAVNSNFDNQRPDAFLLRGLEVTHFNFRKNGFMDPTYTPRDFANVERIDVLKGPASVLYGAGNPAGTVNIVTKKAQQDRFATGYAMFGSWDLQRYATDVNSTNQAGDILYRINTAYQNQDGFRNTYYNERVFVTPTITFLLDEQTSVTWEGEYHKDRRRFDSGIIVVNGDSRFFNQERFFGVANDYQEFHDYRSTLSLTHKFNDEWQWYVGGTALYYDAPSQGTIPQTSFLTPLGFNAPLSPQGFFTNGPGNVVDRSQSTARLFQESNYALISNLTGEFETGRFVHHTLIGTELDWFVANHDQFLTSIPGVDPPLQIDPSVSVQPYPGGTVPASFTFDNPGYRQNRFGLYFQDLVELTQRLKVMGGVRYDNLDVSYNRSLVFGGFPIFAASTDQNFNRWSPRVGVVYEIVPGALSTYGTYSRSFNQLSGSIFALTPAPLLPELGEIYEAGFKANIFDNLQMTIAGFHILRENVSTQITNFTVVQAGTQRSQGAEINLAGQWTNRWSTVSNYTYADVTQTGPAAFPSVNGRVRGVPFGTANIWNRYNFIQERDRTLGAGLGWVYVGERRGDYTSPLELQPYSRWDAGVYGRLRRWDMSAYVENIFDVRYETGSINQYQVYPGAPVNFRFTVGASF
jgi:iron complex outermembrane receptor protein